MNLYYKNATVKPLLWLLLLKTQYNKQNIINEWIKRHTMFKQIYKNYSNMLKTEFLGF